ncbi:hypothetical protein LCL95_09045 [Bacillus timonensis]|nr:hypothetical protein [Bacillus timonensis]
MYWKLRIPLFLFVICTLSGIGQKYPELLLANTTYFISSTFFIGLIVIIFALFEETKINEKEVHFTIGIVIILVGFLLDYWMV